jgi:hypothetical protein
MQTVSHNYVSAADEVAALEAGGCRVEFVAVGTLFICVTVHPPCGASIVGLTQNVLVTLREIREQLAV